MRDRKGLATGKKKRKLYNKDLTNRNGKKVD